MEILSSGVIAAPIIPFESDGAIDWSTLESYIEQVGEAGPRAVAMNMALSEGASLTIDEQLEVVRRCKQVLAGRCAFLSGVNVGHTAAAIELGGRMIDAGADGLVIFPPVPAFLGPLPVAMIAEYHADIARTVPVPLIAFQTNYVAYPAGSIEALSKIPTVVAIKDASFSVEQTLMNVKEGRTTPRKIGILTGSDTFILEAMLMGCDGALIGFAATATAQLVRMHDLVTRGGIGEAYEIWKALAPIARIGWSQPLRDYRVRMKYVLMKQGVIPNMVVRKPLPNLSAGDRQAIDAAFAHGFDHPEFLPAGRAATAKHAVAHV